MSKEQDIFDELATLCTSPGYVHAIAYLCFRDNIVRYQGEMTAKDMQNLFSPTRLVRTEMSTLIGLLMKEEIDYGLPTPEVTQQYITRTEELLNEMHREMLKESFGDLGLKEVVEKGINPFTRGSLLREVIFYGGESGYSFQYRDLSVRKYAADNQWLESNKGFSIEMARDVVQALGRLHTEKLTATMTAIIQSHTDQWTLLPGFSFSLEELSILAGIDAPTVEKVLNAFTLPREDKNQAFRSIHDFNVANATPILRLNDQDFVLFQQYSLAEPQQSFFTSMDLWLGTELKPYPLAFQTSTLPSSSRAKAEAVGQRPRIGMEKGLLFDRVALHYTGVAPGNVQSPASVVANLAYARLALRDGAAVTTGKTAYPVAVKFFVEFALADILVNDIPQRRHTPQPK